jgi:RNA-directed DNA polymerase
MNEFDQFVKHELKARCYLRYADDFVLLSEDRKWLENCLPKIAEFLRDRLRLKLHPKKIVLKTFSSGVDFLGWTHFINHRVLRTASRKRMLRRLADNFGEETVQSYLGLLSHGNAYKLRQKIIDWE